MTTEEEEKKKYEEAKDKAGKDRQRMVDRGQHLITEMGIDRTPEMPAPLKPGQIKLGPEIPLMTNIFGIRINDENAIIYRYDVSIWTELGASRKMVDFTKKGNTDHIVVERKKKCVAVFAEAIKQSCVYRDDIIFYYDGQSIMYTMEKLAWKDPAKPYELLMLDGAKINEDLSTFPEITFTIKQCTEGFMSSLSDIRRVDRNLNARDRSAMQFVDVATSMSALFDDDRFTVFGNGKIFPNRPDIERLKIMQLKEGKVLIPGMTKSMKLVEGPRGRDNASPAITVESLKAAFHEKMKLIDKAQACMNINNPSKFELESFSSQVRGLGCTTNHMTKNRKIEIHGVSLDNAKRKIEVKMENGGTSRTLSVEEYFQMKYGRTLIFPNAPLAISRMRGQMNLYPMECLDILPMQRVTVPQTTGAQSQVTTKACAVGPAQRQNEIMQQCEMHDLFNPNQKYLLGAGISIVKNPLKVTGRQLPGPALEYRTSSLPIMASAPAWRTPQNMQFAVSGNCGQWAIYALLGPRDNFNIGHLQSFAKDFVKRCRERGLNMPDPAQCEILGPAPSEKGPDFVAREKIKEASYHNVRFLFFVVNDQITIHKYIKLEERYSTVITQALKLRTCMNYLEKHQSMTMDNIVFKTNLKLGGLNYGVGLDKATSKPDQNPFPANRLILGIGMSHSPPGAGFVQKLPPPATVGWAANCARFPTEYIGDFIYQDGGKVDLMATMPDIMDNVMNRWYGKVSEMGEKGGEAQRESPKEIIVYRQGVSEGMYGDCLTEEVPLIRACLAKQGARDCKVTYIVVQKDHNTRFFAPNIDMSQNATRQNIGSGIVVDTQATHPHYREFYLNTHLTLQGSARTPRYTILFDESNISMNQIQMVTHCLAFNFQIVNSPISIPAPLYIANRYAERGAMMQNARVTDELATTDQKKRNTIDFWNTDLTYSATPLGGRRVNA